MERIPHPRGAPLAADVDRRDPARVWAFLHGFGSDRGGAKASAVRAAVAQDVERLLVLLREDPEASAVRDRAPRVHDLAVDLAGDDPLGPSR